MTDEQIAALRGFIERADALLMELEAGGEPEEGTVRECQAPRERLGNV